VAGVPKKPSIRCVPNKLINRSPDDQPEGSMIDQPARYLQHKLEQQHMCAGSTSPLKKLEITGTPRKHLGLQLHDTERARSARELTDFGAYPTFWVS
jgi:hypothetical protein